MNTTAIELKALLQKFNKGVKDVVIDQDIISVRVSSKRAAYGVTLDLLRTRAFRSVTTTTGGNIFVHAVVSR
jgi:hypothetical protein